MPNTTSRREFLALAGTAAASVAAAKPAPLIIDTHVDRGLDLRDYTQLHTLRSFPGNSAPPSPGTRDRFRCLEASGQRRLDTFASWAFVTMLFRAALGQPGTENIGGTR